MSAIKVRYTNTFDIVSLHNKILDILCDGSSEHIAIIKKLELIESRLNKSESMVELKQLNIDKMYLSKEAARTNPSELIKKYTFETRDYLDEFVRLPKTSALIDVMSFDHMRMSPIDIRREKIVDIYISIAAKYVKLDIDKKVQVHLNDICIECQANLVGTKTSSSGSKICSCGVENPSAKALITPPKEYIVWGNFLKIFKRSIGDIDIKPIDLIMKDLDSLAASEKEPPGNYYRQLPPDKYGFKKDTSVSSLCNKLSILGYSDYYKGYAYIGHMYYGWSLRTHLKLRILELERNFKAKQDVWDNMSIDEKEGNSSISNPYRLCRELQHLGEHCRLRDFNVSTKRKTLEKYDRVYKRMCIGAGFRFPHYIEEESYSSEDCSTVSSSDSE